jgi:hypothetical protein
MKEIITKILKEYRETLITEKKRVKLHPRTISDLEYISDIIIYKWKKKDDDPPLVGRIYMEDGAGDKGYIPVYYLSTYENEAAVQIRNADKMRVLGNLFIVVNPDEMLTPNSKSVYNTLYHELQHIFDTNTTRYTSRKNFGDYAIEPIEKYFGHPYEQRAYFNEILEGLVRGYKELIGYYNKEELVKSLDVALNFFGKGGKTDDILRKVLLNINSEINMGDDDPHVLKILQLVKKSNPDSWKMFLKMLYSTINEIKADLK